MSSACAGPLKKVVLTTVVVRTIRTGDNAVGLGGGDHSDAPTAVVMTGSISTAASTTDRPPSGASRKRDALDDSGEDRRRMKKRSKPDWPSFEARMAELDARQNMLDARERSLVARENAMAELPDRPAEDDERGVGSTQTTQAVLVEVQHRVAELEEDVVALRASRDLYKTMWSNARDDMLLLENAQAVAWTDASGVDVQWAITTLEDQYTCPL